MERGLSPPSEFYLKTPAVYSLSIVFYNFWLLFGRTAQQSMKLAVSDRNSKVRRVICRIGILTRRTQDEERKSRKVTVAQPLHAPKVVDFPTIPVTQLNTLFIFYDNRDAAGSNPQHPLPVSRSGSSIRVRRFRGMKDLADDLRRALKLIIPDIQLCAFKH